MEWYWIVLIAVGGVGILYTLLCWIVAKAVLKAATTPVAHTLEEARTYQGENEKIDFTDYDSLWEKESFEIDGVHGKIRGELVLNPACSENPKIAVICHGHTWNRINSLKYAKIFYSKGYSLVLYDHAYFGLSDGDFTTLGCYEKHDLSKIIAMLRERFGQRAVICLHGESMGAATVLLELGLRTDIAFVVADCPFSDTMKYYRELCTQLTHLPSFPIVDMANAMSKRKFGYDFAKVSPIAEMRDNPTPICFIHGKADTFIRPSHSEKLYRASGSPLSELHLVEGAGHACSHIVDNDGYWNIVCNFIDKVEASLRTHAEELKRAAAATKAEETVA